MNKTLLVLSFLLLSFTTLFAQQGFKYQAVARDNSGGLIANTQVDLRFQILESSATGTVVYEETHSLTTNQFGLLTTTIGKGTVQTGTFDGIDWGSDNYFLKVELNGTAIDTDQLEGVPYSKVATDMVLENLKNVDISNPSAGQVLKYDGSQWVLDGDSTNDGDNDPTDELQSLSIQGNILSISRGNAVNIPQTIYTAGNGIDVTGTVITNLGDLDSTNEIQSLALNGQDLSISDGNTVTLPQDIYTAGTAIDITNNVVTNTGDTDASDDVNVGDAAGGDLGGTFPNPNVTSVQGFPFSNTNPASGQVLRWNGTEWIPSTVVEGLWAEGTNNIHRLTGDVGVGINTPSAALHVHRNMATSNIKVTSSSSGIGAFDGLFMGISLSDAWFWNYENTNIRFGTNNNEKMRITADGDLGLGTTNPNARFHLNNPATESILRITNINSGSGSLDGLSLGVIGTETLIYNNEDTDMIIGTDNTTRIRIKNSGNIGIGTDVPITNLHVQAGTGATANGLSLSNGTFRRWHWYVSSTGTLFLYYNGSQRGLYNATTGAYSATSDRRLKRDIEDMDNVLDLVLQLEPVSYYFKDQEAGTDRVLGLIAQDVEPLFPELVTHEDSEEMDTYGIDYSGFSVVAIKAIQEQQEKIDSQEKEIQVLKERLEALEQAILNAHK